MAQDRAKELLQQGIAAAKAGHKDHALGVLQQAAKLDPHNETVWLWLSSVARNDQERIFCLRQLLAINPNNELAIKGLKAFGIDPSAKKQEITATGTAQAVRSQPQSAVPMLSKEKFESMQSTLDDFLRSYNPELYTPLDIEWVHKTKKRYGEGAARRLRRSAQLSIAAVVVAVLALITIGVVTLLSGEDTVATGEVLFTATPTSTVTPTATIGIPDTPVPAGVSTSTPVMIAANIEQGNALAVASPTALYPLVNPNIRNEMATVVADFSLQNYEESEAQARDIRQAQQRVCYSDTYYYEALSLAKQGSSQDLRQAEQLLQEGLVAEREAGFDNTCVDSTLLRAGLCFIQYEQAVANENISTSALNEAFDNCEQAHEEDPRIVISAETLAKIHIIRADVSSLNQAFQVVTTTLNEQGNQNNVILLLTLADIELAPERGRYEEALVYIETALYINPTSEVALQKRVEAYFALAEDAPAGSQLQTLRYSSAAQRAEEYLFLYQGSPEAYVLVAKARIGEGNPSRALGTLNRLLAVEEELPATARDSIREAHELRAQIYFNQRDWGNAFSELDILRASDPDNMQWVEMQKDAALALEQYDDALLSLEVLIDSISDDNAFRLEQAQLLTRICQYEASLDCDYRLVLDEILTNRVMAQLEAESAPDDDGDSGDSEDAVFISPVLAEAIALRTEAEFALLMEDEIDEDDDDALEARNTELQRFVEQLTVVFGVRETAADYYLLGQIYSALGENQSALRAFDWVLYWDTTYDYPFGDDAIAAKEIVEENLGDEEDA